MSGAPVKASPGSELPDESDPVLPPDDAAAAGGVAAAAAAAVVVVDVADVVTFGLCGDELTELGVELGGDRQARGDHGRGGGSRPEQARLRPGPSDPATYRTN